MYKILLDELRENFDCTLLKYTDIIGKCAVFDRYSSISGEIIRFLRGLGINAGYENNKYGDCLNIDLQINQEVLHYGNSYPFLCDMDIVNEIKKCEEYLINLIHSGIKVYLLRIPYYDELAEKSLEENYRHDEKISGYTCSNIEQMKKVYGAEYDLFRAGQIGRITQSFNGEYSLLNDIHTIHTNVIAGVRVTYWQPEDYDGNVFMLGPCTIGAAFSSDKNTIPSVLQQKLNCDGIKLKVNNYGIVGGVRKYLTKLKQLKLCNGDYVMIADIFPKEFLDDMSSNINKIDLLPIYDARPKNIFFEEPCHMAASGNRYIGEKLYEIIHWDAIGNSGVVQEAQCKKRVSEDTINYIKNVLGGCKRFNNGEVGAIVMNCNPFTFGHEFLIKKALEKVDFLYIFVVEEDRSKYSFSERFDMVVSACKDFQNICVLPSGKAILSMDTLPEYFNKDHLQGTMIDTSYDVLIFAEAVAPTLNISKRFVGEEPFDSVTRQYNQSMKRILPEYGIELVEIPRMNKDGVVISASEVRRLEKAGAYETIKQYVPMSTYKIISQGWK